MNKYPYALLAASALIAAGPFATIASAQPRDGVTLSFSVGDVAFGYHDGYYDRERRWHRWASDAERDWYREHYGPTYYPVFRDRDRDSYRLAWRTGRRAYWYADGDGADFALVLGNVVIAYDDGYYDRDRRWHSWPSPRHRDWYRTNRRDTFFAMRRDLDRDRYRRDWWEGRRSSWRVYGGGGPDFAISLGNVVFAYDDGYYDRERRWHVWRSDAEREWYRRNNARTYFAMRRDLDRDRYRRDWWEGRRADWRFYGDGPNVDFAVSLGGVVFAYEDGYYDRERRWHTWRSDAEREWYRRNHARTYFAMRRDLERDRMRRDWWEGRRNDWRDSDDDVGEGDGGPDDDNDRY